jgi:hypothetical protein
VTNLAARMPSPFTLEKDVDSLRNELRREVSGLRALLGVAVTLAAGAFLASLKGCGTQPSSTRQSRCMWHPHQFRRRPAHRFQRLHQQHRRSHLPRRHKTHSRLIEIRPKPVQQ